MAERSTVDDLAAQLYDGIGLIARRLRQLQAPGELSLPERAALSRLARSGSVTSAELARAEQITPQAMGNTLNGLESRSLIERTADPNDGRRFFMSLTDKGRDILRHKRNARTHQLADALKAGLTEAELDVLQAAAPLLERLADQL